MAKSPDLSEIWAPRLVNAGVGLFAIACAAYSISCFVEDRPVEGMVAAVITGLAITSGNEIKKRVLKN